MVGEITEGYYEMANVIFKHYCSKTIYDCQLSTTKQIITCNNYVYLTKLLDKLWTVYCNMVLEKIIEVFNDSAEILETHFYLKFFRQ